ncbi:MAG: PA2169 family four-helix-bundle protein [Burkholderiaceae bacterium]|nr:PA2169 family four-helix-bundle protein [Burkholderiaceae bacterium]
MTNEEIISTLNELIKVCNDGSEGFKACAEHANVDSPKLKMLLVERQRECASASDALRALVVEQGADPATGTTASGALHRGWLDIKTAVSGKKDLAVLEECERGEDAAKEAYRKALAKDLPSPIRAIIEMQYQGVLRNHDQIRALRDEEREVGG